VSGLHGTTPLAAAARQPSQVFNSIDSEKYLAYMTSNKTPTAMHLIREIQRLARLVDELIGSDPEIGAELDQLQQLLSMKQRLVTQAYPVRSGKPN